MGDDTKQPIETTKNALSAVSSTQAPKKSKKGLIIGLISLLGVLILGGGLLAVLLVLSLNNKPEKVLADAVSNLVTDTFAGIPVNTKGSFKVVNKGEGQSVSEVSIEYQAKAEQNAVKFQGSSEFSADVKVKTGEQTINVSGTIIYSKDKTIYIKLENVRQAVTSILGGNEATAEVLKTIDPIITKIDNKWISITENDIKELAGNQVSTETVSECSGALQKVEVSKADQKAIKRIFKENPFFSVSENLKTEDVNGQASFHYRLDANQPEGKAFITEVGKLDSFKELTQKCGEAGKGLENEVSSETSETKPVIELWVGKKDRRVNRIAVTGDDKEVTVDLSAEAVWNSNVAVEIPEGATSVQILKQDIENLFNPNRQ